MNNLEQLSNVKIPKKDKFRSLRPSHLSKMKSKQLKLQDELQNHDFKKLAHRSTSPREKRRLLALAYLKEGKSILEIATILNISDTTAYDCVKRFNQNKLEGLKEKKARKPRLKIYSSQKEEFAKHNFKELANHTTDQEEKKRLLALSYLQEGKNIRQVACVVKVSTMSVYNWIKRFNEDAVSGLKEKIRSKIKPRIYSSKKKEFEKHNFHQLANQTPNQVEKRRLLALAYLQEDKYPQEVANALKVSANSIYNWVRRFNKNGLNGLKEKNGNI
jgi:transposase